MRYNRWLCLKELHTSDKDEAWFSTWDALILHWTVIAFGVTSRVKDFALGLHHQVDHIVTKVLPEHRLRMYR